MIYFKRTLALLILLSIIILLFIFLLPWIIISIILLILQFPIKFIMNGEFLKFEESWALYFWEIGEKIISFLVNIADLLNE